MTDRQRVVVVTGGGGGIGAAIAEELGRSGWFVVTVDPLVTLDGSERLPEPAETTAGRIVDAGGSARASSASVTDGEAVRELLAGLVAEHGGLDALVNVAGITRPTGFGSGSETDWREVLDVHLNGYLTVLQAALPLMAVAGYGRIIGVTSGSGWRPADAGAYSCAKRAVAALTWQLGRCAPAGVTVNAMSPIAVTRMVTAAMGRAPAASRAGGGGATGGLSLAAMPDPAHIGPLGAHLVSEGISWCQGRVVFAGGSEVAVIAEPRLLEVLQTDGAGSLSDALDIVLPAAWAPAEAAQASGGGANPRFPSLSDGPSAARRSSSATRCAVIGDRPAVLREIRGALEARGTACSVVDASTVGPGFAAAADALRAAAEAADGLDAVVVALAGGPAPGGEGWEQVLAEHAGIVEHIQADASWARAAADHAAATGRSLRLVTVTDASTAGGRSRAQAAAQLARAGRRATSDGVVPFAVEVQGGNGFAELVGHLVCHPDAPALAGAELAAGDGWVGLRSHPRPSGSVVLDGPVVPSWLDTALREIAR